MSIQKVEGRRARAWAVALAALAGAAQLAAGVWQGLPLPANAAVALLLAALTGFAFGTRIAVRRWWGLLIALAFAACASTLLLHLPLLHWMDDESDRFLRVTSQLLQMTGVTPMGYVRGVAIAVTLLGALFALTANLKWISALWFTLCWAFCLVDCAILEFSGNPITVNDILSIRTALNVAGNYHFTVMPLMITHLIVYAACMAIALRAREERPRLARLPVRLLALACAALALLPTFYTLQRRRASTFGIVGIRRYSVAMEFLLELKSLDIDAPKGYSTEAAEALGEKYPARAATVADEDRPHVIAVMIEAFSDLSVLGDFETSVDYMPFTRDLMKRSVSGHALVSTLGGGTARSEWEFLTGNSMAFMPGGSMPFRQFTDGDENSLVRVFENAGYRTVGMHPYYGSGWGRNEVYPALGFDDVYFLDDLPWDDYLRGFVSDKGFVRQVIDLFEHRDFDAPMFLFGVTMQNHSDYLYPGYPASVRLQGLKGRFPAAEQYLSLIKDSDDAVRELIEYFSGVDEPVQIVFFGDHQPAFDSSFYRAVGMSAVGQKYLVPFVMWDNYAHRAEDVPMTSLNFLGARLIDLTGVQKPAWYAFLSEMNGKVDAMDHRGYVIDGEYYDYNDDSPALEALAEYRLYQYANMFDEDADRALFNGERAG